MGNFENYESERLRLLKKCDEVERIWRESASSVSEFESLVNVGASSENSTVLQFMKEARSRLASSTIEVGVFGSIKRGKSTLVNALLGADISPMRVTPETAVPVWIESGDQQTLVVLGDGSVKEVSLDEARLMATQRFKPKHLLEKPLRVVHRLRIPWLPRGVRVIDTPGLDDPSLAEDYEKMTLAELDRVAATIFLMVSPPGPSGEEMKILKSLGTRAVDKLFLVCNFYEDQWTDPHVRETMVTYIEEIVLQGAGDALDRSDIRVYPINAKRAFRAAISGDEDSFEKSGCAKLRADLETYLADGALDRMLGYVEHRVRLSGQILVDLLEQRHRVINTPGLAKPLVDSLRREIQQSRLKMSDIEGEIRESSKEWKRELTLIIGQPIENAIRAVGVATKRQELELIFQKMNIQFETAASEASTFFEQRAGYEYARLHRKLYESFGVEERIRDSGVELSLGRVSGSLSPSLPMMNVDKTTIAAGGLASGLAGGLLGGAIAGGAGMALIALGPVGWIAGFALGAIFGAGAGGVATRQLTRDNLGPDQRKSVADELTPKLEELRRQVERAISDWTRQVIGNLESFRSTFFSEREGELKNIERILSDSVGRNKELEKIQKLLSDLRNLAS